MDYKLGVTEGFYVHGSIWETKEIIVMQKWWFLKKSNDILLVKCHVLSSGLTSGFNVLKQIVFAVQCKR